MRSFFSSLAERYRLPVRSGLAELDLQIEKLRTLRDSYREALHTQQPGRPMDLKKDGVRWCIQ